MQLSDEILKYLDKVCEQIRFKKSHSRISDEIKNHIIDQKAAYMEDGYSEEEATKLAIREMGDPVLVGSQLDRTHRPHTEWSIIILTGLALFLGLFIQLFITYDSDYPHHVYNSIISIIIGTGCMVLAYYADFTLIGKYAHVLYIGLILVTFLVTAISPKVNGQITYSPFLLLLIPTAYTGILYKMRLKGYLGILLSCGLLGLSAIQSVYISQSKGIICIVICLILLTYVILKGWFNVNKMKAIIVTYLPFLALFAIYIMKNSYRLQRIQYYFFPRPDNGMGFMSQYIHEKINNGKFIGSSNNVTTNGTLFRMDYLLTYLIDRYGWISFVIIMIVIIAFIIRSFILCSKQKSYLGRLVSTSVLLSFTMQVILYIANNFGFILVAPFTLPFISYGGTATVINMLLIGIMLSVFKSGNVIKEDGIVIREAIK